MICSLFLSNTKSSEKTPDYSGLGNLKIQFLKDSTFLSKPREKITSHIDDQDIQKTVKDCLLTNPEIMIEMQLILQGKARKAKQAKKLKTSFNY
ncbi:hypothetical protein [Bartonella quintana]|uniref:hypothetical protein n=1 Tax=Bartonella quintana TaxID=803 RepID=UPI001FCF267B|nr:hypothetical protein [Bartonella quintana]